MMAEWTLVKRESRGSPDRQPHGLPGEGAAAPARLHRSENPQAPRFTLETLLHKGRLFIAVVRSTLHDFQTAILYSEYNSVFIINVNTPIPLKIASKRFGLPCAIISVTVNINQEPIDFLQGFLILCLPIQIFVPSVIIPKLFHQPTSIKSCSFKVLFPERTLAIRLSSSAIFSSE